MEKSKKIDESEIKTNWFGELLEAFVPSDTNIEGRTVKQLINSASRKAFWISFASALPPGLFGWATLLPEIIAITKIQINLVHSIAKFYNQEKNLNFTMIVIIFSNALGLELGKGILVKAGFKIVVSKSSSTILKPLINEISVITISRLLSKIGTRFIPLITAPFFGTWSAVHTKTLGYAAENFFSKQIVFNNTVEV